MYTLETDIRITGDVFFAKYVYVLVRKLQSFQMTEAEEVLLRAMCLYSPGSYERRIFTVRNSSCGKVMFSQASVCPQGGVRGEGGGGMHGEGGHAWPGGACVAGGGVQAW